MIEKLLSKSKENGGMSLASHSVKCADNCYNLAKEVGCSESNIQLSYIVGLLHDIGKLMDEQQRFIKGYITKYDMSFLHNEISAYLIAQYLKISQICGYNNDDRYKNIIIRCALYHHQKSKSVNSDESFDFNGLDIKLSNKEKETAKEFVKFVITEYNNKFKNSRLYNLSISEDTESKPYSTLCFSKMESVSDVRRESEYMTILHVLRFCDAISTSDAIKIDSSSYLYNKLGGIDNFEKPEDYDDRFYEQIEKAKKAYSKDFSIVEMPTGFGKTMMGVMYLLFSKRKGFWVCPRNSIAESMYKSINAEVDALGLNGKVSVALLLTNKYVYGDANSDIIVTNLDNYVRPILKDDSSRITMSMVSHNVIFDEFHEYIDDCLSGMFATVVSMRSRLAGAKTMLMSATIPPFSKSRFPYRYCKLEDNYTLITMNEIKNKKITNKEYAVFFTDDIEQDVRNDNTLVSLNSVGSTQMFFKDNFADNIIHSRYSDKDLWERKEILYKEHDKNTTMDLQTPKVNTSWVATNIISTGTDVSFSNLVYNNVQPDRLIQLIGRINRFGECRFGMMTPTITLSNSEYNLRAEISGLQTNYSYALSQKFYKFLTDNIVNGETVKLSYLYELRNQFYKEYNDEIETYYSKVVKRGFEHLSTLNYLWSNPNFETENKKYVCNARSLRNDGAIFAFWAMFKNEYDEMTEPIQVDTMLLTNEFLEEKATIDNAVKYIMKIDMVKPYFKNKYIVKKVSNDTLKDILINRAVRQDTAFPILRKFKYSSVFGVYNTERIEPKQQKDKIASQNLAMLEKSSIFAPC